MNELVNLTFLQQKSKEAERLVRCNSETFIRRERGYVQAYEYSTTEVLHVRILAGIAEETVAQAVVATLDVTGLLRADLPG